MKLTWVLILLFPLSVFGQTWVGLDQGLGCTFGANVNDFVPDEANKKLYVFGSFHDDGNCNPMKGIAVWDGVKWDSLTYVNSLPAGNGKMFNDTLYCTADFDTVPLSESNILGKWNGSSFDTIPMSKLGIASDFTVLNDELYFCGAWRYHSSHPDSIIYLGKYDGVKCVPKSEIYPSTTGFPVCIEAYHGDIYLGGQIVVERNGLQLSDLLKVNQDTFELFHSDFQGLGPNEMVRDLEVFQDKLYIAGSFLESDGYGGNNIMYWDGTQFHPCGGGTNNRVRAMTVYNDELYCAGWFTEVEGQPAAYVAKWDGSNWFPLSQDSIGVLPIIDDIAVWNDELYIGGSFTEIGGIEIKGVAKFNHPLRKGPLVKEELELSIFPNPAETSVQIDYYQLSTEPVEVVVTNSIGQLVYHKSLEHNRTGISSLTLDITDYALGAYIVRLSNSNFMAHSKFIRIKS
ncbi:MAG: hypothetical protein ACI9J3_002548 [Parvicellaceae bacterium]|jgi:hypothetical protein